jgi:hypothetical protein
VQEWQLSASALELALQQLLQRVEKHPGNQTTSAGAEEWRSSIEFHMATGRRLKAARSNDEVLDLPAFHRFAQEHFAALQRKRSQRPVVSALQQDRLRWQATSALWTALHNLVKKRKAAGLSAFLAARRRTAPSAGHGEAMFFRELLKSQCEIAMTLEARADLAGHVGGFALSLDGLQRSRLRYSWEKLRQA